jgi:hypothetical protein
VASIFFVFSLNKKFTLFMKNFVHMPTLAYSSAAEYCIAPLLCGRINAPLRECP